MSENADLITVETYVQGKTIESQFLIYGLKCNKNVYFLLVEGPGGFQLSDSAYLALRLFSHPYQCTCEIRKQSENNF